MPQWRKLHAKITESLDFNEMPDDFTRLTWALLPLGVDSEGRGINNPSWIKSKIFPLRMDVTHEMILFAMGWYKQHGMIKIYSDGKREYFYIPTFHVYQGDTSREAESSFPAPVNEKPAEEDPKPTDDNQEKVESKSGVNQDNIPIASRSDADAEEIQMQKKSTRAKREPSELFLIAKALSSVTGLDLEKNRGRIFKEAKSFKVSDISQIQRDYSRDGPWYRLDWRGKRGERPTLAQIRETWGCFQNGNGKPHDNFHPTEVY